MADGLFDTGGSSGGDSFPAWDEDEPYRGPPKPWQWGLVVVCAVLFALTGAWMAAATDAEREADGTTFVATSRANFERWAADEGVQPVASSVWFEEGSSHRRAGRSDVHCKGGRFRTTLGEEMTVCCSVHPDASPPCLVLSR